MKITKKEGRTLKSKKQLKKRIWLLECGILELQEQIRQIAEATHVETIGYLSTIKLCNALANEWTDKEHENWSRERYPESRG